MDRTTGAPSSFLDPHARRSAAEVQDLYARLLEAWNAQDAAAFAGCFAPAAFCVGFDGSTMHGRKEIAASLGAIFADHPTARYYGKARDVEFPKADIGIVNAVAGMVPRGQTDLNPDLNAVQTMVALRQGDDWRIASFVTTPAAFHGRPGDRDALTEELRAILPGAADAAGTV